MMLFRILVPWTCCLTFWTCLMSCGHRLEDSSNMSEYTLRGGLTPSCSMIFAITSGSMRIYCVLPCFALLWLVVSSGNYLRTRRQHGLLSWQTALVDSRSKLLFSCTHCSVLVWHNIFSTCGPPRAVAEAVISSVESQRCISGLMHLYQYFIPLCSEKCV